MTTEVTELQTVETSKRKRIPRVRIACPKGRPIQLRYFDPTVGREIRVSTATHDLGEAEQHKGDLEAKLRLGIDPKPKAASKRGPDMAWAAFRLEYSRLHLDGLRDKSSSDAESRLDIAERIVNPQSLVGMASRDALNRLQQELLKGTESAYGRPRSPHTVRSHMASVMAALNWACLQGWLVSVPKIHKVKTSKLRAMKGRPITGEEFERMLAKTPEVVGATTAASWKYLLRGLWTSALRLDELMHVSWSDQNMIVPEWPKRRRAILNIPADRQKNATEEAIPLLPEFEAVLLETPEAERTGWVFKPGSLQARVGRKVRHGRPDPEWVGKIISRIGEKANVVVHHGDAAMCRPVKYASAHDLRRSCAERLLDAGAEPATISRVLRHASWETTRRHYAPGDVQKDAEKLHQLLAPASAVPGHGQAVEST